MFTDQLTKVQEILSRDGASFTALVEDDEVMFVAPSGKFYSATVCKPSKNEDAVQFFSGEWHVYVQYGFSYEFHGETKEGTCTGWQTLATVAVVS